MLAWAWPAEASLSASSAATRVPMFWRSFASSAARAALASLASTAPFRRLATKWRISANSAALGCCRHHLKSQYRLTELLGLRVILEAFGHQLR